MNRQTLQKALLIDVIASVLLGVSISVFAVNANFAPGGVTGLAVMGNYLFDTPIGLMTVLINIPVVLLTYKKLGGMFFVMSVKTVLINALFIDCIFVHLPAYSGSRLIAAVCSGVFAGVAYSLLFNADSSTGGTDFVIAALKRAKPQLSFGFLAFVIDGSIMLISYFVYKEIGSVIYGLIYIAVTAVSLDLTTKCMAAMGLQTVGGEEK